MCRNDLVGNAGVVMDLGLKEKPVVIVGGTSGMGYAAAELVAADGGRVALIGRDAGKAARKAAALGEIGAPALWFAADGTRTGEIERAIDAAADAFGGLYGLAVTAGPVMKTGPFLDFADSDWTDYFQSVLMVTIRSCMAAIPHMIRGGGGAIVVTSSYSARGLLPTHLPYIAMKAAIGAVTKNLAKEFGRHAIRVNCVCPGAIATEALDKFVPGAVALYGEPAGTALNMLMKERWGMEVGLQRAGLPQELGELYAFLLSTRAAYMTGAIINQDGGTHFF